MKCPKCGLTIHFCFADEVSKERILRYKWRFYGVEIPGLLGKHLYHLNYRLHLFSSKHLVELQKCPYCKHTMPYMDWFDEH